MTSGSAAGLPVPEPAEVTSPPETLYRIAKVPNPIVWPDKKYLERPAAYRFDDPLRKYLVVYAGQEPLVCFLELLNRELPNSALLRTYLETLRRHPYDPHPYTPFVLPSDWHLARTLGQFTLARGRRWLDFRSPQTHEALRRRMSEELLPAGRLLDGGDALSRSHVITRHVSRWAYDNDYDGIAYSSRIYPLYTCWAIFSEDCIVMDPERGDGYSKIEDTNDAFRRAKALLHLQ